MTFKAPLSPDRSMKYNLFQFKSHVLGVAPHLGIAIFNNNPIGTLTSTSSRISLLHVLDERGRLKFVPLEFQIASQRLHTGSHTPLYRRSPSTSTLYSFTPGTADATIPKFGSSFLQVPVSPTTRPLLESALDFAIDMSGQSPIGTIIDGALHTPVNIEDYKPSKCF